MLSGEHKVTEFKTANVEWEKEGDYSKILDSSEQDYHRSVYYYFNQKKDSIHLAEGRKCQNCSDRRLFGTYSLYTTFTSSNAVLLKKIFIECQAQQLPIREFTHGKIEEILLEIKMPKGSKEVFTQFINIIDRNFPLGNDLKRELYKNMQIADGFYKELTILVDNAKFDLALKEAQSFKDDHILWLLGHYCEVRHEFANAVKCYDCIPDDNPHSLEANKRATDALMKQANKDQNSLLEKLLAHRWKMDPTSDNQHRTDTAYFQLGDGPRLVPSVTNVQPNPNTLFALGCKTTSLREENTRLNNRKSRNNIQPKKKPNHFEDLPKDVQSCLMRFFYAKDLALSKPISKSWNSSVTSEYVFLRTRAAIDEAYDNGVKLLAKL